MAISALPITHDPMIPLAYDRLIEEWNDRSHAVRAEVGANCRAGGHRYRDTPDSDPENRTFVCLDCVRHLRERD